MFGVTSSGHDQNVASIDSVIGPFVTMTLFAINIDPDTMIHDFVGAIKDKDLSLMPYQTLSLPRIFKTALTAMLFSTALVYQNYCTYPKFDTTTEAFHTWS